jgi:hypothetical protein
MFVALSLPRHNSFPTLEQGVFAFTEELGRHCASIASCAIAVDSRNTNDSGLIAFAVRLSLWVFGNKVEVNGNGISVVPERALAAALEDTFQQTAIRLAPIAHEHTACGCGSVPVRAEERSRLI